MKKSILYLLKGREKQITKEEKVLQPLPHKDFRFANPFIVLHHGREEVQAGTQMRIHPHPHRGFAPVTILLEGEGYHRDSVGHEAIICANDVQWMFAGKGLLHSEGPTQAMLDRGGIYEFVQLWVNVPAAIKWNDPYYYHTTAQEQPKVLEQEGVELRLAAGEYDEHRGPIPTETPITILHGSIQKGKRIQLTATPGYWTLLYVTKGKLCIHQESVEAHHLVVFDKEFDEIILCAEEDSHLVYLSAEPIDEPVAAKDNFVMNTAEEVEQAIIEYKNGKFGVLTH